MPNESQVLRLWKWGVFVSAAVYAVAYGLFGFLIGPRDWDHLASYYDIAWRFWLTQKGLPHFNPLQCGGRTLGADPQIPIFHPLTLLTPIFGPSLVMHLEMLAQLAVGAWAIGKLLRSMGIGREGEWLGILLFVSGGATVARFFVGHVTLGFLFLFPLLIWLSWELENKPQGLRWWRLTTAYFTTFVYAGLYKPNFVAQGLILLWIEQGARSLMKRDWRGLSYLGAASSVCLLLNAPTYLPAGKHFLEYPRLDLLEFKVPLHSFFASLLLPFKMVPRAWYGSGLASPHEYCIFLGPAVLVVAWFGFRRLRAQHRPMAISFLVMLIAGIWLGLGTNVDTPYMPLYWFKKYWPGAASIRIPMRSWFGSYLALIVFAAAGWEALSPRFRRWGWALFIVGPVVLTGIFNLARPPFENHGTQGAIPREFPAEVILESGSTDTTYEIVRRGRSVIQCMSNIETNASPDLRPGNTLPVHRAGGPHYRWANWRTIEVSGPSIIGEKVTFNLNHAPSWGFEGQGGKITSTPFELLTLESTTDRIEGKLVFTQPFIKDAFWLFVLGWLGLGGFVAGSYCYVSRKPNSR